MPVIYLWGRRRRPVWLGPRLPMSDVYGEIPTGWCQRCGMECYLPGQLLCDPCYKKEEIRWENSDIPAEDANG